MLALFNKALICFVVALVLFCTENLVIYVCIYFYFLRALEKFLLMRTPKHSITVPIESDIIDIIDIKRVRNPLCAHVSHYAFRDFCSPHIPTEIFLEKTARHSNWYNLRKHGINAKKNSPKFARLQLASKNSPKRASNAVQSGTCQLGSQGKIAFYFVALNLPSYRWLSIFDCPKLAPRAK